MRFSLFLVLAPLAFLLAAAPAHADAGLPLRQGWQVQSACVAQADGAVVSTLAYRPQGWIRANVPTTVLAAQVAAGIFPDPYYGTNMEHLPGMVDPARGFFANLPMPQDSPYRCGWWYRRPFPVPASARGKNVWLHFAGINYRADIWVNGRRMADSKQIAGAYRTYDIDITNAVTPGAMAVLAVEVFAPGPQDLGINWVDWDPTPPDKDMGLWGAVDLELSGPVRVHSPMITTHFDADDLQVAEITVTAQLENTASHPVQGTMEGTLAGVHFAQAVTLAPGETKNCSITPAMAPQLRVRHPAIWWPAEMGAHPLEDLTVRFTIQGQVSDVATARVGVREVTSELTGTGARLFRINHRPILIRGGGWSPDLMLREDPERLARQIHMVQDMHLNTVRLEGKLETDRFFQLADENGLLVMAGWCCCDQWEHWKDWSPENYAVAVASLRSQMLRLRNHASVFVWLNGSDNPPPADVEQDYLDVEKEMLWPNPVLSSATGKPAALGGATGVKMSGPYDYVPPSYWLVDDKFGGAFGFNTETGPGAAIPLPDGLRRFLPEKDQWPIDSTWDFHAGRGEFKDLHVFNEAMRATYGWPQSMEEYSRIAQTMAYDGERAMFEAYARNKYDSTGVIQWMMDNAWPSLIWHLYDYYLEAGGGYYGTKLACAPLHVQWSYDDGSVYAVSTRRSPAGPFTVRAQVYGLQMQRLFDQSRTVQIPADSAVRVLDVPSGVLHSSGPVAFIWLEMRDQSGAVVGRNFYWVSARQEVFNWAKTDFTHTPMLQYADLRALRDLPASRINGSFVQQGEQLRVHLVNSSRVLAFQVQLQAQNANGNTLTQALWDDNYIELLPGESRDLTASLPAHGKDGRVQVTVSGWNVRPFVLR